MQKLFIVFSIAFLMVVKPGLSQEPGDILWQQLYVGEHTEGLSDVKQTDDGGYIAVGSTYSNPANLGVEYLWVIKTDSLGEMQWEKFYGNGGDDDAAKSVAITPEGDFIIAGETASYSQDERDAWILKLDNQGDTIWTRTFSSSIYGDYGESVIIDNDGNYVITGYTYFHPGDRDALLLKYDPDGNLLWFKTYGGTDEDWTSDLCQTEDGDYMLTGFTRSFGANARDSYLIKTDVNGDTLWTRMYGGATDQWGRGIDNLPDGGAIVAGWTGAFFTASDTWLFRVDTNGDIIWEKTYNYGSWDQANKVILTNNGGFILSGKINGSLGLLKTSGDGEVEWVQNSIPGVGIGVIQNTEGDYLVVGQHQQGFFTVDAILAKLKGETMNHPPVEFSLLEPQDGVTLASLTDPVEFVWESSSDPENDTIFYTLTIFNADINLEYPLLEDTTYTFDGSTIFEELTMYQWTVSASDGQFIVVADTFTFITPQEVGIDDFVNEKHNGIALNQNYPNPFVQETTIEFILNRPMPVTLEIFNMHGQKVRTLLSKHLSAGTYRIKWDGTDVSGHNAAKGIYTYRFNGDGFIRSFKMFLTR